MFSKRGVLVSGYSDERGTNFEKLTMAEKFAESRKSVERLHPGHGQELEKPVYVGWGKIPYNEGSWVNSYGPGDERPRPRMNFAGSAASEGYETLIEPDGPIYFVGCHVSHIVAWQEGAALSARRAIRMLGEKVKAAKSAVQ
jgi:monoamine oxidase